MGGSYSVKTYAAGVNSEQTQKDVRVRGTVVDAYGDPVIGANVVEKGTTNGTVCDQTGAFSLNAKEGATLEISFIGYQKQEARVNGKDLNIVLAEDQQLLDDVVVVGYGTQRKADLTGAVVRADIKTMKNQPNSNLMQTLQGTVPGLNVGVSTKAGGTPSMSIRGNNTLAGNTDILIIVDGIIYTGSLTSINPEDVESIDVLKDASSTAVYGAQAANGVILITTKKGSEGKAKISFSSNLTLSNPTHNYRPMNRAEFLQQITDFHYDKAYTKESGYTVPDPNFNVLDYLPDSPMLGEDGLASLDYDWWGEGTQQGSLFENRVTVSGGIGNTTYYLSYGNTNQKGFIKNDDFKRHSVRVNLNTNIADWWKVGVQAFGSFVNQDGAEPDLGTLLHMCPLLSPYKEDGVTLNPYPFNTLDKNAFMGSECDDRERHNYFTGNVTSEIKLPIKGLVYHMNFGDNYRIDSHYYANPYDYSLQGEAYKTHAEYNDYTFDNFLTYSNKFGGHAIDATLLYGASMRQYNYSKAMGQGYTRMTLGYSSLEQATDQYASSDEWQEALNYQMARLNYRLLDRYLLTATVRRDGFSGFAANNKYAVFPSVSLGWVVSEEKWFKVPCVDYLKLRSGYGVSGNQTSRYKSLARVTSELQYVFGDGGTSVIGQKVSSLGNADLKWEKTAGVNLGVDFAAFNQRVSGSVEYYNTTTKDLLYDIAVPVATGFSSVASNIGKIANNGIEVTVTGKVIETNDFSWTITANLSHNTNKIKSLTGEDNDGDGKEDDNISSNLFIGHSIGTVYGYRVNGIYQLDDEIPAGYYAGNYRIEDINGDGEITTDDREILGRTEPALRFGIMNTLRYKNFSLSFFINSIQGGKDGYLAANSSSLNRSDNNKRWNHLSAYDYWSPSNPNATYARSIGSPKITPTVYEDRSFVRLQDVNLSYSFNKALIRKIGLSDLNVFMSGKNLLTFTKWHGWDPEAGSTYSGRPVMRSFSFGLNVTL